MNLGKIIITLLFLIYSSLCLASNPIDLSHEELQFIKGNPVVTLGASESFEPFIFKDAQGNSSGLDQEIANIIEQKTGLKITFEFGVWNEIQALANKGKLDGLSTVVKTDERKKNYNFSSPYLTYSAIALVNRANHRKIFTKEDVQHRRAAVQRGNKAFERLTKSLGDVKIVYYDDIYSVLNAVVNNEVDFTILDESIYYVADELGISGFISTSFVVNTDEKIHFAFTLSLIHI